MTPSELPPVGSALPLRAVDLVGPYRLIERIGAGGMGDVWHAVDTDLEREVALKTLRPELGSRADLVERFRIEAIALARLHHRNIAAVYACFADGGRQYMAQQYVRGRTLESVLAEQGRLPWPEAVAIARDLLAALEHAHGLGVVHRDLKPANVIIDEAGRAVVLDFGIARITSRQRQTRAGTLVGTLHYLAPELIRGDEADARSDLYAVATLLHEMLGGRVPFDADSDYELMRAVLEVAPPSLRPLVPDVPAGLVDLVARGLDKQPARRPVDARSFDAELASIQAAQGLASATAVNPSALLAVMPVRVPAPPLGRLWTALDLPRVADRRVWWQWSRANPGVSAGAMAVLVLFGVIVSPMVSSGLVDRVSNTSILGGPASATYADQPSLSTPRAPVQVAHDQTTRAELRDAGAVRVLDEPPPATLPPLDPVPRGPVFVMPPEPSPSVSIDPGSRSQRLPGRVADATKATGATAAAGAGSPPATTPPGPTAGNQGGAGKPPGRSEGRPGWYVRQ